MISADPRGQHTARRAYTLGILHYEVDDLEQAKKYARLAEEAHISTQRSRARSVKARAAWWSPRAVAMRLHHKTSDRHRPGRLARRR